MIPGMMHGSKYSRTYGSHKNRLGTWLIPALYALAALAVGLTLPRIENHFFPGLASTITVGQATAIYSAIASGMIALTGIVFSLAFVMIQFSASAYSPRLVLWIARDPVMSHALGIFTATFLYALAALSGVDRNRSGNVPFVSLWLVIALLLASVAMFIRLIQLIGLLQVNQMLIFTGDRGRTGHRADERSVQPPPPPGGRPSSGNNFVEAIIRPPEWLYPKIGELKRNSRLLNKRTLGPPPSFFHETGRGTYVPNAGTVGYFPSSPFRGRKTIQKRPPNIISLYPCSMGFFDVPCSGKEKRRKKAPTVGQGPV